jgi:hypothetical protein
MHAQILSCWYEQNETIDQHYKNARQPGRRFDWQKIGYQRFFEGNRVNDASYRKRGLASVAKRRQTSQLCWFCCSSCPAHDHAQQTYQIEDPQDELSRIL